MNEISCIQAWEIAPGGPKKLKIVVINIDDTTGHGKVDVDCNSSACKEYEQDASYKVYEMSMVADWLGPKITRL